MPARLSKENIERLYALFESGKTAKEAAAITGLKLDTVRGRKNMWRKKVDSVFPYCHDEADDCAAYCRHRCRALNDTRFTDRNGQRMICPFYKRRIDFDEIFAEYSKGGTVESTAAKFGISSYVLRKELRERGLLKSRGNQNFDNKELPKEGT